MAVATSRTLAVLKALSEEAEPLSLAQISQRTGVGRASLSRLLQLLLEEGAVASEYDSGKYTVGFWAWQVGIGAIARNGVRSIAFPHMLELARSIRSTVNLALLDFQDTVFVESVVPRSNGLTSNLSMIRYPLLDNASGRVMAAYLPPGDVTALLERPRKKFTPFTQESETLGAELARIKLAGYATIDREHREDLSGVAVPVRNHTGRAIAALGLPITGSLDPRFVERVLPIAFDASRAISNELGFHSADRLQLA